MRIVKSRASGLCVCLWCRMHPIRWFNGLAKDMKGVVGTGLFGVIAAVVAAVFSVGTALQTSTSAKKLQTLQDKATAQQSETDFLRVQQQAAYTKFVADENTYLQLLGKTLFTSLSVDAPKNHIQFTLTSKNVFTFPEYAKLNTEGGTIRTDVVTIDFIGADNTKKVADDILTDYVTFDNQMLKVAQDEAGMLAVPQTETQSAANADAHALAMTIEKTTTDDVVFRAAARADLRS